VVEYTRDPSRHFRERDGEYSFRVVGNTICTRPNLDVFRVLYEVENGSTIRPLMCIPTCLFRRVSPCLSLLQTR
jgi:hypothetical protein